MKTKLLSAICILMILTLVSCGGANTTSTAPADSGTAAAVGSGAALPSADDPDAVEPEFTFKVNHGMSAVHCYNQGALKFAELVKERTNGAVVIEVYPGGQLGAEREACEALQLGTLDFQITSTAPLANFNRETVLFDLPFLFENKEHARTVLDGEFGQAKLDKLEDVGIVGLAYMENTYFDFVASKPMENPEDAAGMKIRIMENAILAKYLEVLGATPVPMIFAEVPAALQNGTIDAVNVGFSAVYDIKLFKDMYYTYIDSVYTPVPLLASKIVWDTIPAQYQEIIRQAAKDARDFERQFIDDTNAAQEEEAKAGGMTFVQGNQQAWIDKVVEPVYSEFVGDTVSADDIRTINSLRTTPPVYEP